MQRYNRLHGPSDFREHDGWRRRLARRSTSPHATRPDGNRRSTFGVDVTHTTQVGYSLDQRPYDEADHRDSNVESLMVALGRWIRSIWFATSLLALPAAARAEDAPDSSGPLGIEIHGFVSRGFIKTTSNNYLAEDSTKGSFEFSEVGINFSKQLTDRMRVGMQLFTHDLGPLGNYRTRFDWFYLDYRFWDFLGVRAGRTKLPFGLYNENNDIDAARVPVLLPQSVYPVSNRDFARANRRRTVRHRALGFRR